MESGIGQVRLYKNTTNTIPGTYEGVTSSFTVGQSASQTVTLAETGLTPNTQYWYWVQLIDLAGNDSGILPLGSLTTTPDTTPPTITSTAASLARNRDVSLSWGIADNIETTNIWVLNTTDPGKKTNFDVISGGVALSDTDTAYTFTDNKEVVTYYFWVTC